MILQQHEPTAALRRLYFRLVDVTDGYTAEPGLTFAAAEIVVSKAGGAFANAANSATVVELTDGAYYLPLSAGELDTVGPLLVKIEKAGCRLAWIDDVQVVPAGPYLQPSAAVTTDAGNSTTSFETDLASSVNDFYNGMFLVFVSASALTGQVRKVADYNGTTKIITLASPLTVTPTVGDKFALINA